ncbi:hypothetical protein OnM2_04075 [Erysiphe neolycopersici]|uniref:Uncharacterized protein n=1 Tax=Erysiphe neolycopersici TaxID=212602 RepID=A0A420HUS8_9PEZI|nr:hypothetical protein OnM2_04075 [Erysiphe neolycopersici]
MSNKSSSSNVHPLYPLLIPIIMFSIAFSANSIPMLMTCINCQCTPAKKPNVISTESLYGI